MYGTLEAYRPLEFKVTCRVNYRVVSHADVMAKDEDDEAAAAAAAGEAAAAAAAEGQGEGEEEKPAERRRRQRAEGAVPKAGARKGTEAVRVFYR